MSRYDRQIVLPEIGQEGQARLGAARVLVIGAGGLGSALLPLLAGAGVGYIRLFDPDRVAQSNLHRQTLFRMADLGAFKAEVAARGLRALNPDCRIDPVCARCDPLNARAEIEGVDLVIDAADSFAASYALSDLCQARSVPLITASVAARQGYVGGFCGGAPSLRAVFPDLPAQMPSCAVGGVMGPVVALLGALQAQMALAVLLGHSPSPLGQVLSVDCASWRIAGFRFDAAQEPEVCVPEVLAPAQVTAQDRVIDLRDGPAPSDLRDPTCRVVFRCTTGLRAWRAARALSAAGHSRVAIIGDGQ
ncbi:thiamine biosynthesis protein ThiF [Thioclava dalianensis]|uniref:Thiamine biosynthesis protein ThiF n=1 Tax=Thioclava dalianensis TaxID=1185766 RepID=A0A074TI70_9RHOB|nr:HesA/MoeB/ThiF family protein [Thioclava dalianensis]KEP71329.1 thiamine biosynthesis protein ThiF [Thioclava dalianensis]SFM77480.1 Molybdopterin or thiamine biosynthesis adenylyltransferase [Thioclava dalianensis]